MENSQDPNPLAMEWEERLRWYDGIGATLGLMALVVWMQLPPRCRGCREADAVDRFDVYLPDPDGRDRWVLHKGDRPLCGCCVAELERGGWPCVLAGREPYFAGPPSMWGEDGP